MFHSRLLWTLDLLTFRVARALRIGPWYCTQCEQRKRVLRLSRNGARNEADESAPDSQLPPAGELIGNYIKTDQSLVIRRNRASRYSLKYRDGIVKRIFSGATFSQLTHELNVSEQDLVDWMADLVARKQEQVEQLQAMVDVMQRSHGDRTRLDYDGPVVLDENETIDGHVRSRS
ncbi:MAG: hypothetical protein AAF456_16530 [Planctomycetota bacterium]